jgi:hypothetical protein
MVEVAERQKVIVSPAAAVAENKSLGEVLAAMLCPVVKGRFGENRTGYFRLLLSGGSDTLLGLRAPSTRAKPQVAAIIFARAKIRSTICTS